MKKLKQVPTWLRGQKRSRLVGASAFMLAFVVVGVIVLIRSFAAGSSLTMTPATTVAQAGTDYTVTLFMNSNPSTVAVDATIAYDQSKLTFKSIDTSTSGFPSFVTKTGGAGKVNVAGFTTNTDANGAIIPLTGKIEVAKVTFTVNASATGSATLVATGQGGEGTDTVDLVQGSAVINISSPTGTPTAGYSLESTVAAPGAGSSFGLKLYATSTAPFQGGEVIVNLPAGISATGNFFDATGTAFNPATTVNGTTAQSVHVVFVTQSTTLTGKQLVGTIPVTATTTGAKSITFSGARIADNTNADIPSISSDPFSVTINTANLPAPVVTVPGKTTIATRELVADLKQSFTITNFDSGATYSVKLNNQTLTLTNNSFSIPASVANGDLPLQVTATKNGSTGSATYTILLRSPNINRTACVELSDLLVVNKAYGSANAALDLNNDGNVSLIDLLLVTSAWGQACA